MRCFIGLLLLPLLVWMAPSELGAKDVRLLTERLLKEHAKYKSFDKRLAERALESFVSYLDPFKTYLTAEEIEPYLHPDDALLAQVVADYSKDKIDIFERIHALMQKAILRRGRFEAVLKQMPVSSKQVDKKVVHLDEIKPAPDLKGLVARLKEVRALQLKAGSKLTESLARDFPKLLEKNRRHFEKEITGSNAKENMHVVRTAVVKAVASALDSQTSYLTPSESKQFVMGMQKKLVGIGAVLRDDLEGLRITELLKGGPAEKSLRVDDQIIAVDGRPIVGMHIIDSVELIRGKKGVPVLLTIARGDEICPITIERDEIVFHEARTVCTEHPFANGHIAHIRLHTFYDDGKSSTSKDVEKALKASLKKGGLKGVVLDLRGNPGGLLSEAIDTASCFMDRGIVASLKSASGAVQHLRNLRWEPTYLGPLVILVDAFSASSSEIVAGALQDYGRALVVGERTFGKGTFQLCSIPQSGDVGALGGYKVTSGIYYTVSGKSPQLNGIEPDISIKWIYDKHRIGERFGKFPLDGGQIESGFEDDLADVPIMQRSRIRSLYRLSRQEPMQEVAKALSQLKENSKTRLANNSYYREILDKSEPASLEPYDLQLDEAIAITKDLIFLSNAPTA